MSDPIRSTPKTPDASAVGISFVSIFLVVFQIVFFPCGLSRTIGWDYLPGVPQGKDAEIKSSWRDKPLGSRIRRLLGLRRSQDSESGVSTGSLSHDHNDDSTDPSRSARIEKQEDDHVSHPVSLTSRSEQRSLLHNVYLQAKALVKSVFLNPNTLSLVISIPIALVPQLKALFVDVSAQGGLNWKGPDGQPPLAFMINTGTLGLHLLPIYNSLIFLISCSKFHRWHHRPYGPHPSRRGFRPIQDSSTVISSPDHYHPFHMSSEDGHHSGNWYLHGPRNDEAGLDR